MVSEHGFTKKQVVEITGLTPRQVQFYTEQNVVFSSIAPGEGRGQNRRYSEKDLIDFCIIKQMAKWGMTVSLIRKFITDLRKPGISKRTGTKSHMNRYTMPILSKGKDGKICPSFPTITFFYNEGSDNFDAVYDPGGSRAIINRNDMRAFDSALAINIGKIITKLMPHCPKLRKDYE